MKTSKTIALSAIAAACAAEAFAVATNDWAQSAGGNTPATAFAWTDGANWKGGAAPGDREIVRFFSPAAPCYVALPDELCVQSLSGSENVRLIGDQLYLTRAVDSTEFAIMQNVRVYADVHYGTDTDAVLNPNGKYRTPYFGTISCAGRVISDRWNVTPAWGTTAHRLDWYATSANPLRTDDIVLADGVKYHPGSGHVAIYAPQGADACTGTWRQTAGSPYLERVSADEHPIAVGTVVTGAGIPDGTYVRRKFESNLIELSQSVTETVDANELAFAAFTPDVRISIAEFNRQGNGGTDFKLFKYREQDTLRVEIGDYQTAGFQTNRIGLTAAECKEYVPGTFVFRKVSAGGHDGLQNCHLELAGEADGTPTAFSASRPWFFVESWYTARVTVTEDKTASVAVITNWTGALVKDGAGSLSLGFGNVANSGSLVVSEGTVALGTTAALGGARPRLASLRIASGAMLQIPAEGLVVDSLETSAGSVVSGPGELQVMLSPGVDFGSVTLTNGAVLKVVGMGVPVEEGMHLTEKPVGAVVGHPAFWVDASKPETIDYVVENGVNYVTRWNDCREGEPMFCTNIARRSQFVNGDLMTNKYVRIAPCTDTEYLTNTEQMVWSVPIKDVRAVFLVQDPTEGGGELLGRCSWRLGDKYYGSRGGPFYRSGSQVWSKEIIARSYGTPCVTNGWTYLNGARVDGLRTGYLGKFMQLVEHHVNTNYPASNSYKELWCDAFGTGYADCPKETFIHSHNGGQRMAECIVYTNSLTYAERAQVAQYLSQKWLGKDAAYVEWSPPEHDNAGEVAATDASIEVGEGRMHFASEVSGTGTLTKTGAGILHVEDLLSGTVSVEEGELRVRSRDMSDDALPTDAWLHVDASRADTVERGDGDVVTKWHDVRGNGVTIQPLVAYRNATWTPNALNGRAVVDTGVLGTGAGLRIYKADGTQYLHEPGIGSSDLEAPVLKTVFIVHGSKNGGGSLLGCLGNCYPAHGFPHNTTQFGAPMVTLGNHSAGCNPDYWWGVKEMSIAVSNKIAVFRQNGVAIDPFVDAFSGGYDVFSFKWSVGRKSDTLACYGQNPNQMGGLEYAEIVAYERMLSDDEFAHAEAILRWKWFNHAEPGMLAIADGLFVSAGAKATIEEGRLVQVGALGGAGVVDGDVRVAAGGALCAEVAADGTVAGPLVVDGTLDLSQGGRVVLSGAVNALKPGRYALATASSATLGGMWTCDLARNDLKATLVQEGDAVVLRVLAATTLILFR